MGIQQYRDRFNNGTFGIAAIILYAPSGVIADKFPPQNDYFRDDHLPDYWSC